MSQRGPIVCATDLGQTGARAVDLAARMASATGRPLRLVHVTGAGPQADRPEAEMTEAERVLRDRLRTRIERAAAALEKERQRVEGLGPHAEAELLEGRAWEETLEYAIRHDASVIVVGPHGESGPRELLRDSLKEFVLGSTADRIVRHAPMPVLVASREGGSSDRIHGRSWLVAVDFSEASRAALAEAHELAEQCQAKLLPLHVLPDHEPQAEGPDPLRFGEALTSEAGKRALAELERLVEDVTQKAIPCRIGLGEPASAVSIAAAELDAALIVMGTRGLTGIRHLLLGSTAERTLRRSPVPVLCVPTRG